MSVGAVMAIWGGLLLTESGGEADEAFRGSGIGLMATGGILCTIGVMLLTRRVRQRRLCMQEQAAPAQPQYWFAPIIAPERQLYGLAGMVSF